ncbi:hypothetical protein QAD02_013451 [Eretmocerus hayati]|uniref:Uncharacterized protein n=1 Tax=Eretmocerus hayati TaxID=131215 RepID=A0ACC2P266_9HYME|nr:hypothetical protein QAD02_013451 [Eretmocerus hayati]
MDSVPNEHVPSLPISESQTLDNLQRTVRLKRLAEVKRRAEELESKAQREMRLAERRAYDEDKSLTRKKSYSQPSIQHITLPSLIRPNLKVDLILGDTNSIPEQRAKLRALGAPEQRDLPSRKQRAYDSRSETERVSLNSCPHDGTTIPLHAKSLRTIHSITSSFKKACHRDISSQQHEQNHDPSGSPTCPQSLEMRKNNDEKPPTSLNSRNSGSSQIRSSQNIRLHYTTTPSISSDVPLISNHIATLESGEHVRVTPMIDIARKEHNSNHETENPSQLASRKRRSQNSDCEISSTKRHCDAIVTSASDHHYFPQHSRSSVPQGAEAHCDNLAQSPGVLQMDGFFQPTDSQNISLHYTPPSTDPNVTPLQSLHTVDKSIPQPHDQATSLEVKDENRFNAIYGKAVNSFCEFPCEICTELCYRSHTILVKPSKAYLPNSL